MNDLPLYTSDIRQEVRIRMGPGQASIPPMRVFDAFDQVVQEYGNEEALFQKRPRKGVPLTETPWTSWTWKQYRDQVNAFGKALLSIGFERFDTINIMGFNSPEWFICNFGAMAAGGVASGIYTTNGPEACKYITDHSRARVVVVDSVSQLEKYDAIAADLPYLKAIVLYGSESINRDMNGSVKIYHFDQFIQLGTEISDVLLKQRTESWKPGETCELVYTSGTTGPPKSVMITHDNITWTARTMLKTARKGYLDKDDKLVSYLPLSHIAAQALDMFQPLFSGCKVYFAQPDALKGSLVDTLRDVRPTVFFGVPRVWEKIYDRMQEVAKTVTGVTKIVSTWAKEEAAAYWRAASYEGQKQCSIIREFPLGYYAAQLLLRPVHQKLGLDQCNELYVSAAPIDIKILQYFQSLDIPILDVFGQSESTGPHLSNQYNAFKVGTVGRPMLGTDTKIDRDTGELRLRGRNIFAGYMGMPQLTEEAFDDDGYLRTGDIATVDDDVHPSIPGQSGFYTITGRIKELIITAGGENIPPVLIETEIKHAMAAVSNAMVIGDKRKFLTVLISLHVEVSSNGVPSSKLAGISLDTCKDIGSLAETTEQARDDPKWCLYFDNGLKQANEKATSQAQRVGKWFLIDTDFSEKVGELTPTMKLKRSVAAEKYKDAIESMYA
ncbi:long-chain-fatty-acid--CoA ligase ACSBG [Fistulifera solaris]|uniref:Long-chain-fatty-acid--CoA ligase ACSBG n=1 Tax=Fistulifera solaris TaxID=1519565 RepID=A0A1Z5KHQ3_FISSO|nr:long-chain-fatty-acid--CoA ligase ACSBG [Fistulifera solaris]|eukprot:GAX25843.1 long-chain-fatty-acid--CoA ligase ACSBG [Fistulifera solaris]